MKESFHYKHRQKYSKLEHIKAQTSQLPRKNIFNLSPLHQQHNQQDKKHIQEKEDEKNIGQNISLIAKNQEASFISNKQDRSLDSFDKMIIGQDEEIDFQDEYTNNSKDQELNYTLLYEEFIRLIKGDKLQKQNITEELQPQKNTILEQQLFQNEQQKNKEESFEINTNNLSNIKHLKIKLQEIKELRKHKSTTSNPDISIRLLGANLSEIHDEEIPHNTSINRMDPIQEEFINFVSKQNQASKINISKIQKNIVREEKKVKFKNELNNSLKEAQEDEVVAMLQNELGSRRQNLIEQSIVQDQQVSRQKKKSTKEFYQKQNYNHILRELDENEDKKLDISQMNISSILNKREEWINNRRDKSQRWKSKELTLLQKIKQISSNPYAQFSDSQSIEEA